TPVSIPRNQQPPRGADPPHLLPSVLLSSSSLPSPLPLRSPSSWPVLGRVVLQPVPSPPPGVSIAAFPRARTNTICQLHLDTAALSHTPGCQTPKASSVRINKTCSAPRARLRTSGRPGAALEELPFGSPPSEPCPSLPHLPSPTLAVVCSGVWLDLGQGGRKTVRRWNREALRGRKAGARGRPGGKASLVSARAEGKLERTADRGPSMDTPGRPGHRGFPVQPSSARAA
ncbi:hypothetical protein MC885_021158, partial [Smutsia gigantea]